MLFPRARIGHKSPGLLRFSNVSVRSPAGPGGSSRAMSPGLLGTCPFSQWCEILWVYQATGLLDWKDCNTKIQLESPPAS